MLQMRFVQVHEHMLKLGVDLRPVTLSWFQVIFVNVLPFETAAHVRTAPAPTNTHSRHTHTHTHTHTHPHTHTHSKLGAWQVWDVFFFAGFNTLVRVGLALLRINERMLLKFVRRSLFHAFPYCA
jgi:hypothetical protein